MNYTDKINEYADKINEFRLRPPKGKTSTGKTSIGRPSHGQGALATLVVMYLAFGRDYASNMVKEFRDAITEKNGWDECQKETFRSLRDQSQIQPLLDKMEKEDILISEQEKSGRKPRFFSLSPALIDSIAGSENQKSCLLKSLGKENRGVYLKSWGCHGIFVFETFIYFLHVEASKRGLDNLACKLDEYLQSAHLFKVDSEGTMGLEQWDEIAKLLHTISSRFRDLQLCESPNEGVSRFRNLDIFMKVFHDPSEENIDYLVQDYRNSARDAWTYVIENYMTGLSPSSKNYQAAMVLNEIVKRRRIVSKVVWKTNSKRYRISDSYTLKDNC